MKPWILAALCAPMLLLTTAAIDVPPSWSQPIKPFKVAGPIWYVGTRGLAVYAIVAREGTILVSGPMAKEAGQVERNLVAIGVQPRQVKWILNSHAHFDHAAAFAELRRWSGARVVSSAGDATALRRGRHEADNDNGFTRFPSVAVDRVVGDGEQVRVGRIAITAVLTPGHTPGCTTWSLPIVDGGRSLQVVFPCSITVAGNHLVNNRAYPGIDSDYRHSFDRLAALHADIVLPMHPEIADVLERAARPDDGDAQAFVDPTILPGIVAAARTDYAAALDTQRKR
ncbi:subclass B3 metallo-beta-lactamase [Sphingomonas sp. CARO-RG-8B-R24-01]|uniref:subclass B3 metallo-beta-lactamase n=1 Tax=Sphingomonas sp. CARO-RG-8B-R24-01 TaxID=2914831 RepID=UPI001F59BBF9|nr:subclass B3 metallo-beta-lactamase [Sphingomonas sp. CARO-RG-8B-R24-01]